MRLADSDWNHWPDGLGVDDVAALAASEGLDELEVGVYRSDVELAAERVAILAALPRRHGVRVSALLYSLPPERWPHGALSSPDAARAVADEVEGIGVVCRQLDVPVLGLWPGADVAGGERGRDDLVEGLRVVAAAARSAGIVVAVEPKPGTLLGGTGDAVAALDLAGEEELGVLLDTAHAFAGGEDPAAAVRRLGARLLAVHLGDADLAAPDADLPCGRVHNFAPVVGALRDVRFPGVASFDLYGCVTSGVLSGAEAVRQSRAHLLSAVA